MERKKIPSEMNSKLEGKKKTKPVNTMDSVLREIQVKSENFSKN